MRNMEEKTPDVDEDGHPLTISAAQRMFHKNNEPLYIAHPTFKNYDEANTLLMQGK